MLPMLGKVLGLVGVGALALALSGGIAWAGTQKLVIQVSTDDARTQAIALNNAVNVQKALGPGNVEIEIVAYGPGLSMLTNKSKHLDRVSSLAQNEGLVFSACGNTMKKMTQKTGQQPVLIEGIKVVQAGVLRIMELQQQGWAYVRP